MSDEPATSSPTIADPLAHPPETEPVGRGAHAPEPALHDEHTGEPEPAESPAAQLEPAETAPAVHDEHGHAAATHEPVAHPHGDESPTHHATPVEHADPAPAAVEEAPKTDEPTPPKSAKRARTGKASKIPASEAPAPEPEPEPVAAPEISSPDAAPATEPVVENKKKWYAIKVQSGREDSIKAAVLRKVRIEGLEEFFGRIEIPVEEVSEKKTVKVKDKKTGETTFQEKKVTRKKKKFQGYLFAELEFNDRILYLFRETSGVGDFLNLRHKPGLPPTPEPMPEHEVQSMLTGMAVKDPSKKVKIRLDFEKGDKVRIRDGSFANSEGEVKAIIEAKDPNEAPKVSVELTFWGRPLVVEFDSNQVEKV
jgi:transcriptional antiterminator NusG